MPTPQERFAAFSAAHGGQGIISESGAWLLYPDGASRERHPCGAMCDPPSDQRERAIQIKQYWTLRTAKAEELFEKQKAAFEAAAGLRPGYQGWIPNGVNSEEVHRILTELREEVMQCRDSLEIAEKSLKEFEAEVDKDFRAQREVISAQLREAGEVAQSISI